MRRGCSSPTRFPYQGLRVQPGQALEPGAYTALTEWLIRRAEPSEHRLLFDEPQLNGYYGDQNPLKIDGKYDPVATGLSSGGAKPTETVAGRRGDRRIDRPDPGRIQPRIGEHGSDSLHEHLTRRSRNQHRTQGAHHERSEIYVC